MEEQKSRFDESNDGFEILSMMIWFVLIAFIVMMLILSNVRYTSKSQIR